jgi:hypothetical protein
MVAHRSVAALGQPSGPDSVGGVRRTSMMVWFMRAGGGRSRRPSSGPPTPTRWFTRASAWSWHGARRFGRGQRASEIPDVKSSLQHDQDVLAHLFASSPLLVTGGRLHLCRIREGGRRLRRCDAACRGRPAKLTSGLGGLTAHLLLDLARGARSAAASHVVGLMSPDLPPARPAQLDHVGSYVLPLMPAQLFADFGPAPPSNQVVLCQAPGLEPLT